jgi:23S rRNA (guanosine2251-2'-O)-methyltransferase
MSKPPFQKRRGDDPRFRTDAPPRPRSDAAKGPRNDAAKGPRNDTGKTYRSDAARGPRSDAPPRSRIDDAKGPRSEAGKSFRSSGSSAPRGDKPWRERSDTGKRPGADAARAPRRDFDAPRRDVDAREPRVETIKTFETKRSFSKGAFSKGAFAKGFKPRPHRAAPPETDGIPLIFGFHAVEAALANTKRTIRKAFMTENAAIKMGDALKARGITPVNVSPRDLDKRLGSDTVHQGALLEVDDIPEPTVEELARNANGKPLVILDHVTDPHNVGAILRSAAVFGVSGVMMTKRHSPPLGGVLAKAASGALELVPIVRVQNLARTLQELKEAGFTLIGLDDTATEPIEALTFTGPIALVLGAEGKGLRELTQTTCDKLVRISSDGPIASLNVSNAAAVALHSVAVARMKANANG